MPYPPSLKEIQDIGLRNGLDSIGIAKAEIFESTLKDLQHRKSQNLHAGMSFTYRNPERSTNPKKTMPEGQSLIVGAKSYWQPLSESAKNIDILGLILARPVPAFAELSTLAAGMIKMPFKKFLYVIVITNIGVAIIFSGLGAAALSNESSTIAFFGVAIFPAILYIFYKKYIK